MLPTDRRFVLAGLIGAGGAAAATQLMPGQQSARSLSLAATTGAAKAPPPLVIQAPAPFGKVSVAPVPLGAGGFVTGLDISRDGTRLVCRVDVCNAYVRNAGEQAWSPLFSPATMRQEDYDPLPAANGKTDGFGCAGLRLAPSDKDVLYAAYLGYVWRSADGGKTISRTALPQKNMPANTGWQRLFNRTIDVHPTDPDQVIVGTWKDGAWYTLDGGARWARIGLPEPGPSVDNNPGIHLVLFNPAAPDRVYVFVTGVGLFRSSGGLGGEFRLVEGGPLHCSNLVGGGDGTVYLCESEANKGAAVWILSASGWRKSNPPREVLALAVDPHDSAHLFALNADGFPFMSRDLGKTWASLEKEWSTVDGEVGWMGGLKGMFPGEIQFDPVKRDLVWIANGVGMAKGVGLSGMCRFVDWSAGIESLIGVGGVSVPGGKTFLTAWDKPFWRLDDESRYSNTFRYPRPNGLEHSADWVMQGTYIDYAADDPRFMVGVAGPGSAPGYSRDGGDNWSIFDGAPPKGWGYGGCIAASTARNFVLLPSNNTAGAYTLDQGKTWQTLRLDGVNDTDRFANAFYVGRKNITADKTRAGVFALVYTVVKDDHLGNPLGGLWLTRDGGRTWDQRLKGVIGDPAVLAKGGQDGRQFWQCKLDYVPGFTGELLYTAFSDAAEDRLWWSRDDGASWRELHPAIRNVGSFGFGKAAPGQTRPVLFFWGSVGGVQGLYASADWATSPPVLLTRFPSQLLAGVSWVQGDANRFGRAYVGTSGGGWVSVQFNG